MRETAKSGTETLDTPTVRTCIERLEDYKAAREWLREASPMLYLGLDRAIGLLEDLLSVPAGQKE